MIDKKRLISTFIELVKIDSVSGEEKAFAAFLVERLNSLRGKAFLDSYGNVIAKFDGQGESYMLNAHMDTVEPGRGIKPIVEGDKIVSNGRTIVGGDAKAGIAIILEAMLSLKESKAKHIPLEVVFTRGEETGLFGAINLDYGKIKSKKGLTFDGPGKVANLIIAAPGYNEINVKVTGRASHAGSAPEKGISAIKIAAEIISSLKVGRIDHETTANIGLISGGTARNAVPEVTEFQAEIRSRNLKKLLTHTSHFQEVIDKVSLKYPDAKIDFHVLRQFDSYRFNEKHTVVRKIKKTLKEMGFKANLFESGGGTDVNIFHTHGIEAICVGMGVYDGHTTREYVKISEMHEAAEFLERFVKA